ncbi:hypothetical protein TSUD_319900 [Trifolium subterraneum]|uniref:Uncharacterized protein n=1 Tax=Trifolium subterraneum TaxID=3900 RepID=A0A2Z6NFP9_TRISU|nr:hypothetical protein TSUD_319900 [Trifolium subterraneum]
MVVAEESSGFQQGAVRESNFQINCSDSDQGGTELEKLLKQKTFTRHVLSEIDHLTSLMRSRTVDASSVGFTGATGFILAVLCFCELSWGADDKKEIITVMQEVMVYDQVMFTLGNEGGVILLPWAPGVHQDAKLKVVGGINHRKRDIVF